MEGTQEKPFDVVGFVMALENGELEQDEVAAGMQILIDRKICWQLQGFYGRLAKDLIEQGLCHP